MVGRGSQARTTADRDDRDDRLARLEAELLEVRHDLGALSERLASLEGAAVGRRAGEGGDERPDGPGLPAEPLIPEVPAGLAGTVLTLTGRSVLVLAGAFLIRATTEAGTVTPLVGIALGLAYAGGWLLASLRPREGALGGTFHAVTSLLIAFPLAWEAATRFKVLPPALSGLGLVAVASGALIVASRRRLVVVPWVAVLGAIATVLALIVETHAMGSCLAALLGLLAAAQLLELWSPWGGPRWPAALVADLVFLVLVSIVTRPGGPPEAYSSLGTAAVLTASASLLVLSLGAAGLRALRGRDAGAYEVVQLTAALGLSVWASLRVLDGPAVGIAALGLGLALEAVAFVAPREQPWSAALLRTLGASLLVTGSLLVAGPGPSTLVLALLALASAAIATRDGSSAARLHAAGFVLAGGVAGGLLGLAASLFLARVPARHPGDAAAALAALVCYGLDVSSRRRRAAGRDAPSLALALAALLGTWGFAALGLAALFGSTPASLATIGTGLLAAAAVGLALGSRGSGTPTEGRGPLGELGWLATPLLVLGAAKLLVVDLRTSGAGSLFLAFCLYGAALIAVARQRGTS